MGSPTSPYGASPRLGGSDHPWVGIRGRVGNPGGMREFTETANFRGNDALCLVEASLACSICLSGDVEWSLRGDAWDAEVECRCRRCGDVRTVSLTGEQALRLSVDPALT